MSVTIMMIRLNCTHRTAGLLLVLLVLTFVLINQYQYPVSTNRSIFDIDLTLTALNDQYIFPFAQRHPPFFVNISENPWRAKFRFCDRILKSGQKGAFLIISVTSRMQDFHVRKAIRESWASDLNPKQFGLFFNIGQGDDAQNLHEKLRQENVEFGDLLVSNISENYYHLPLKTAVTLSWVQRHCPKVNCHLKTDSDVMVIPKNVMRLCESSAKQNDVSSSIIYGHCWNNASVRRDANEWKTNIPRMVYNESVYPRYCSGTGYMLTMNAIHNILTELPNRPWPNEWPRNLNEDVTFTGLLAQKANVHRVSKGGFSWRPIGKLTDCAQTSAVYTAHSYRTPEKIRLFWENWLSFVRKCDKL